MCSESYRHTSDEMQIVVKKNGKREKEECREGAKYRGVNNLDAFKAK